jgi:hypothetical protein
MMSDEYEVFKKFMEETKQGLELLGRMWEVHEKKIGPHSPHRLGQESSQLRKEYHSLLKRIDRLTKKFDLLPERDFIKDDLDFQKGGDLKKKRPEVKRKKGDTSKRRFSLMRGEFAAPSVYTSRTPREAALKAATKGFSDIRLREHGTNKVHVFKGWTQMVDKPANGPAWLPDRVKKANVKKVGIEHL